MKTNGGPAFPHVYKYVTNDGLQDDSVEEGMSLRDWFAGQALTKCLDEMWGGDGGVRDVAQAAYQIADAMLAERERT